MKKKFSSPSKYIFILFKFPSYSSNGFILKQFISIFFLLFFQICNQKDYAPWVQVGYVTSLCCTVLMLWSVLKLGHTMLQSFSNCLKEWKWKKASSYSNKLLKCLSAACSKLIVLIFRVTCNMNIYLCCAFIQHSMLNITVYYFSTLSQYLENYLWVNYTEEVSSNAYLMSICCIVNEKFRENVPAWEVRHASLQPCLSLHAGPGLAKDI